MSKRFDKENYDDKSLQKYIDFKEEFMNLEEQVNELKDGRAKSLVLTYLEITYMWIGKALRDECNDRNTEI